MEELWSVFVDCTDGLLDTVFLTNKKKFFDEWVRKLAHARLAEFVKCYTIQCKESNNKHVKGGQTLRDELYGATKRSSAKNDTMTVPCLPEKPSTVMDSILLYSRFCNFFSFFVCV